MVLNEIEGERNIQLLLDVLGTIQSKTVVRTKFSLLEPSGIFWNLIHFL